MSGRTCGLIGTYVHGCRCDLCRAAGTAYQRELRRRRRLAAKLNEDRVALPVASDEGDVSWMERGACRDPKVPTSLFFPQRGAHHVVNKAKAICAGCEVRTDCLDYALRTNQRVGIWGGVAGHELRQLSSQHRRKEVA